MDAPFLGAHEMGFWGHIVTTHGKSFVLKSDRERKMWVAFDALEVPHKWRRVALSAHRNGLIVHVCWGGHVDVTVPNQEGRDNAGIGLRLCQDGTAYRTDVPAELTTGIRTEESVRKILGV